MEQRRVGRISVLLSLIIVYGRYPRHIYGEGCKENCPTKCSQLGNNLSPCNCETRECYEGCIPGYHGLTCNLKCGNCLHNICYAHSGQCTFGCIDCFSGRFCKIRRKTATCMTGITTTPTPRKMATPTPTPTPTPKPTQTPKPVSPSILTGANIEPSRYTSTSAVATRSRTFGTYSSPRDVFNPGSSTSSPTPVHNSIEIIGSIIAASLMVLIVLVVTLLCHRSNMLPKRTEKNSSPSQTNEETQIVDESQLLPRYYEINDVDIDRDATPRNIELREMPFIVTTTNSVCEKLNIHSRVNCESVIVNVMSNTEDDIIDPVDKYLDPVEI